MLPPLFSLPLYLFLSLPSLFLSLFLFHSFFRSDKTSVRRSAHGADITLLFLNQLKHRLANVCLLN